MYNPLVGELTLAVNIVATVKIVPPFHNTLLTLESFIDAVCVNQVADVTNILLKRCLKAFI